NEIRQRQEFEQRRAEMEKAYGTPNGSNSRLVLRRTVEKPMSEEEIKKLQQQEMLKSINMELRRTVDPEKRVLGYVQKIDCKGGVTFTIKSGNDTFQLLSKDFQGLDVNVFDSAANNVSVGCGADIASLFASITFKERTVPKSTARGDLIGLDF